MKAFYDVGELGWALYLSARINYLNNQDNLVITNRPALFNCKTESIPELFWDLFGAAPADCFGRFGVGYKEIKTFFVNYIPDSYELGNLNLTNYKKVLNTGLKFKPYKQVKKRDVNIIVFPRYRKSKHHNSRNLPRKFYIDLIHALCKEYDKVVTIGTINGAYNIHSNSDKYVNLIGQTNIQELIDYTTSACVTIGGTSAPPKIAMLQGTPSYIIGHEKDRFVNEENWADTEVGFWQIDNYKHFDFKLCIKDIMEFVNDNISLLHN